MAIIVLNIAFDKQVGVSIDTHLVLHIACRITNMICLHPLILYQQITFGPPLAL
jgi:endonuclease III